MHNLVVVASRRSGSTFLWNCIFDLVRSRWPDATWEREFEPFEWGLVEMQGHSFDADRHHSRKRHQRLPLFANEQFRAPSLALILSSSCDVKITKMNVGLGRAAAIRAYPNTMVIHIVRKPQEVLSSLRHEKFELASVDWPIYLEQYVPWLQVGRDRLICNAIRWAHDNWSVMGHSDLLVSYNHLMANPKPAFKALDTFLVQQLEDQLGVGKEPNIERLCGSVKQSTREIRLTSWEQYLVDTICLPVWEALVAGKV